MKKIIHFIGIDVSKETLDIALIRNNDKSNIYSSKVTNNKTGFKKMKQWLKVEKISLQEAVFCIEHTGMYSKPIGQFILSLRLKYKPTNYLTTYLNCNLTDLIFDTSIWCLLKYLKAE